MINSELRKPLIDSKSQTSKNNYRAVFFSNPKTGGENLNSNNDLITLLETKGLSLELLTYNTGAIGPLACTCKSANQALEHQLTDDASRTFLKAQNKQSIKIAKRRHREEIQWHNRTNNRYCSLKICHPNHPHFAKLSASPFILLLLTAFILNCTENIPALNKQPYSDASWISIILVLCGMGYCLYRNKNQHDTDEARMHADHYHDVKSYNNASQIIRSHILLHKCVDIVRASKLNGTNDIPVSNNDVESPANNV